MNHEKPRSFVRRKQNKIGTMKPFHGPKKMRNIIVNKKLEKRLMEAISKFLTEQRRI